MFALLGALLAAYVVVAVLQGAVIAKRAAWGERIERDTDPARFWTVIAVYSGLAAALVLVF
jgi:hypothetical protein